MKLNKTSFSALEGYMPAILKSIYPPFGYCQADLFGPIFAYNNQTPTKRWVLVVLCLSSCAVLLEILRSYSALSISSGSRRTFALQGTPRIIWIDAGLTIVKSGKDLMQPEVKVVSELNLKFSKIEFKVTLPKHHEGIGAVERVIGDIKNTVSKSVTGPNLIKMNEELLTWLNLVIQKLNNRPSSLAHHLV